MKKIVLLALLINSLLVNAQERKAIYLKATAPIEKRVEDALQRMTLEEKIAVIHAQSKFSSSGVPKLGIPENWMTDGPHGIREEVLWDEWAGAHWTNDSCIAFPALTCLAATWNTKLAAKYGKAIGEEARYRNKNVLLGPGVNIYRSPFNGRNFEYMGEDPYLASMLVVPYVKEVQKNGVASCVKHFVLNNQETRRGSINVIVGDRALHEIYLPAFKAAVMQGKAWAIMGAYNQYKNEHCCHNQYLLQDILKKRWGFDGVVISDWAGTHDTKQAIKNGLDMEFGTMTNGLNEGKKNAYDSYFLAKPYLKLIQEGKIGTKELDDKVRRILRLAFRTTMNKQRPLGSFGTKAHALVAKEIAEEGIVLLQNKDDFLPLNSSTLKKVVVIGENATKKMTIGGGSSSLKAKYEITPLQGIKNITGNKVKVKYVKGYVSDSYADPFPYEVEKVKKENQRNNILRKEAIKEAQEADVVIFVGGLNKKGRQDCEGWDRTTLSLPYHQNQLIEALANVNKKIVVVLVSGNAVAMPWKNKVPSIVESWYLGSEAGNAIASVLFGKTNPSGKLPFSFLERIEDCGAHTLGEFPGDTVDVRYNEGIYVGYRWLDKQKIKPLFSFGHGLSYTTFSYGKVKANKKKIEKDENITFSIKIKNTGEQKGKEVVQLYIRDKKSTLPRPIKELKGFKKVSLLPNEEKLVTFTIDKHSLAYFNDKVQRWVTEEGEFEVLIGSSSTDIKDKIKFSYQQ